MQTSNYGSEIVIGGNNLYPTLLTSEELSLIMDRFISLVEEPIYLKAYVRKTMSKGIEYKVLMSNKSIKDVTTQPTNKEYSIVIHPNWNIDILDHWLSPNGMPRCEKINAESLNEFIYKIIVSKKESMGLIEINPIFKKEDWTLVRKIQDVILI